jgi:hypothetical protein
VGPWIDVTLIVASPLLVVGLLTWARGIWSGAVISSFVMVWAIGHHLPGMLRAYGDRELYRRFRWRFTLVPLLLMLVCSFAFLTGVNSGLLAVAAVWGWWHYLMQTYGFCRIYDAKVGSFAASTRWLDQALCLVWFLAAVVLNDNALYGFVENFYQSGLSIPSSEAFALLRSVVRAATAAITLMFVVNLLVRWRQGALPNPIKLAVLVATFACFWYSAATVTNIVVAYAFFELFHDVQYLTIVWAFNRRRIERDDTLSQPARWLFQPRLMFVAAYVILVMGYGSLKWGSTYVTADRAQRLLSAVFLTSTLLHYYFDGFIWKLRDSDTRAALGLAQQPGTTPVWRRWRTLRHGMLWLLFLIPWGTLSVMQVVDAMRRHELDGSDRFRERLDESARLAAGLPDSFRARFTLGIAYEYAGQLDEALEHYQVTLERCPGFSPAEDAIRRIHAKGLSPPANYPRHNE